MFRISSLSCEAVFSRFAWSRHSYYYSSYFDIYDSNSIEIDQHNSIIANHVHKLNQTSNTMRGGLSGVQDVDYATISDEWSTSDESITKGFLPITHEADSWSTSLDDPRINSKGNRFLDASGCQTFVIAGNTNNIALENGNEEDYEFAVDYLRRMKTRKAIDLSKYESFVDELQGALQNRRGHSKSTIEFWVFVIRVISLFGAAAVIWAFVSKTKDPENWSTDDNSNDDLVLRRTVARGSIMSTVKTIVCTCLGAYMVHVGVAEQLVVTNLGFVLNPVLGYMLLRFFPSLSLSFSNNGIIVCFCV